MEEKNDLNKEDLKKETVDTVNQVKETMKNVDIKNEAKVAKGFLGSLIKDPFSTIKEIVDDSNNKHFKTAIIFILIWTVVVFIKALSVKYWSFNILFNNILSLIKSIIAPALGIIVMSAIIYFMNKNNKKSLPTIITAVTTAQVPVIVASVVSLLTLISSSVYKLTSPFSSLCSVISTVLTYFVAKSICKEEKNSVFFKKYVAIMAIYYVAYILISFLEIYI